MLQENLISADDLIYQSDSIVQNIDSLISRLPKYDITCLSERLKLSALYLSNSLVNSFNSQSKMDKIKAKIRLTIAIQECIDTLNLMSNLKYDDVSELTNKVNSFNQMLINSHHLEVYN